MDELSSNIKNLDASLDAMAQAAWRISETDDWVALAALVTLEGMMDDLGDRLVELRGIRDAMKKLAEERDGVR